MTETFLRYLRKRLTNVGGALTGTTNPGGARCREGGQMETALLMSQMAFLAVGAALGGTATKAGGVALLLSVFCFGAYVGWRIRGRG